MHYLAKATAILLVYSALLPTNLQAQFQLNLTGNYSENSINHGLWGPGFTLRYFTNSHLAIGLNTRYSTKNTFNDYPYQGLSAKDTYTYTAMTGQVEYFFTMSALRPYIGLEAGLLKSRFKNEMTGATDYTIAFNQYYFLIGPKFGLQYSIGPSFGVNLDAGFQQAVNGGSTGKTLLLGGGIFFKLGHKLGAVSR